MRVLSVFVTMSILLFSGCQEEPQLVVKPIVLLPSRMEENNLSRELKYDGSNRVIQLIITSFAPDGSSASSTQSFLYNDQGKVTETSTETGWRFLYQYENDLIVKSEEYVSDQLSQIHRFAYDDHKRVVESITYQDIPEEGGVIPVAKATYSYDVSGNVLENKLYYYSIGGTGETLLTRLTFSNYDDKINSEAMLEIISANPNLVAYVNNPGKLEVRNGNGFLSYTDEYSYTYNTEGYAVSKETKTTASDGNTGSYSTHYFFK